jgi:cytochrome c oxidase subunit 3
MSGRNVIAFDQNRRSRRHFPEESTIAMLVLLLFDTMIMAGMVGAFMLTRAAAGGAWPPDGQPWFPPEYAAIDTAALLVSGALVCRAARAWEKQKTRIAPLLLAAMVLGMFFLFFQGALWVDLIYQGLTLSSSQHSHLFFLIVATHATHVMGGVVFLGVVRLRLKPLRDDDYEPPGSLNSAIFRAACLLWYFTVGVWPILYLCLFV